MAKTAPERTYQIKVTLQGSRPPIWRRLLVPGSIALDKLHDVLQAAIGWDSAHLHRFNVHGEHYGVFFDDGFNEGQIDETGLRLNQVLVRQKDNMVYEYDFGDRWTHKIILEKIVDPADGLTIPRCVAGARACPPEDCGGIWGYAELLKVLRDPTDAGHKRMFDWVGEGFDPEGFSMAEINERLEALATSGT